MRSRKFLYWDLVIWIFHLLLFLLCPISLDILCLHFQWVLESLWFLSLFLHWQSDHMEETCPVSMSVWAFYFCWSSTLSHGDLIILMVLSQTFCTLSGWPFVQFYPQVFDKVLWGSEKKVHSFVWGRNVCKYYIPIC